MSAALQCRSFPAPFDRFPVDITVAIFDELERKDCLECMVVSRPWRQVVFECASTAFSKVTMDASNGCQRYKALLENVGLHVKSVSVKNCLDAAAFVEMMTLLMQHCQYLTSLVLLKCYVPGDLSNHVTKLTCLKHLTLSKSSLVMAAHPSTLIMSLTTTTSPALESLFIESPFKHDMSMVPEDLPPSPISSSSSSLRFLYVRCTSINVSLLEKILQHCPNLIGLRIPSSKENECQQIKQIISQHCPKLKYVYLSLTEEPHHLWDHVKNDGKTKRDDHPHSLYGLSIKACEARLFLDQCHLQHLDLSLEMWKDEYPSLGTLQQLLQQNTATLRTLILRMDGFLLLNLLPFLHSMPCLQSLELDIRTTRRPSSETSNLPSASTTTTTPPHHTEPESPMIMELLEQLKQLSSTHQDNLDRLILRISDTILTQITTDATTQRMDFMATTISEIPHLRRLKLCNGSFVSDMMVTLFSYPNQVEHVHLTCGLWEVSCELLRVMPRLLRSIYLHWQGYNTIMDVSSGWRQFANRPDGTPIFATIEYVPFDDVDCGLYLFYSKKSTIK
ncbi:hypothetical protein O0I10_007576 [Lichtheimia ornata]|uniref:F-box domain-containing protein n=1 Tax=Lichtheimia ornata TaxID=688661 RepID=A0AAD7V110_9FUNG|nr:uncharacterized protein O0I10_007576 [Lichtheimia ornata]KAJ8656729.1 hypothetical protein O0I10_007576 [Lichtheimia ornata]